MTIYLDFLYSSDLFKNMEAVRGGGGGANFSYVYLGKTLKSLFVKNVWSKLATPPGSLASIDLQ